jgi:hypothetical protein
MKYFTVLLSILTGFLISGFTVMAEPSGAGYVIYIDSVQAGAGADVPVKFYLTNETAVTSLTVPIAYDPGLVTLKSISFTGSRAQHLANKIISPADLSQADGHFMVAAFQLFEDPIEAGDGLLFTALFGINSGGEPGQSTTLDTLFFAPGGVLEVVRVDSVNGLVPDFLAGRIVVGEPNQAPAFALISDPYILEGDTLTLAVAVSDPDLDAVTLAITSKPAGATFVDNGDGTALFEWVPDFVGPNSADGSPAGVSFWASDGDLSSQMELTINVLNRNRRPEISGPTEVSVEAGQALTFPLSAFDPDFEPVSWSWSGLPEGASFDGANPGEFTWLTSVVDAGLFEMEFVATDPQGLADTVRVATSVRAIALYTLSMSSVEAFPNEDFDFSVLLDNKQPVASFNLLINHDPIALTYVSMTNSGTRSEAFEYFNVQTNHNGVAGNIRIIGIANMGGGAQPLEAGQGPIVTGRLHTTGDLAYAGLSMPLTFQFLDAPINDDNSLTDPDGNRIEQADIVHENGSLLIHDVGKIRVGDINLNGIIAEIGDVIYFTNFFINPSLYKFNALQYANSDVNRDHIAATVSDLVALINIVVNGTSYGKLASIEASSATMSVETTGDRSVFAYDVAMSIGAAYLVIETDNIVRQDMITSRHDNMSFDFRQDGREVKLLLYSLKGETMPSGTADLFSIEGLGDFEITHIELGSADGRMVEVSLAAAGVELPNSYALAQNYPNPFNPETTIEFSLPQTSRVTLTIYNVLGQRVVTLADGEYPAGRHQFRWTGTDQQGQTVASGVYLYRLEAGTESMTRKMMLLK